MVHETVVVALEPPAGIPWAWQHPITLPDAVLVMVNVIVESARAPVAPPRFLSTAETTQGEPQPVVSTDSTLYTGGSVERFEKSITSLGAAIEKSRSKLANLRSASLTPSITAPFFMCTRSRW